jgi:hypothetical protein
LISRLTRCFPPYEYIVANCDIEGDNEDDLSDCIIHGVLLNPAGGVIVGQAYTFSAYALSGIDCAPQFRFAIDGAIAGYSNNGLFSYTFEEAGSHSVQVLAECACGGYFVWDFQTVDVESPKVEFKFSSHLVDWEYRLIAVKELLTNDSDKENVTWSISGGPTAIINEKGNMLFSSVNVYTSQSQGSYLITATHKVVASVSDSIVINVRALLRTAIILKRKQISR